MGGGTDLPEFYEQHGGAVVSTAVNKWIHVVVARRFEGDVRVSYSQTEIVKSASDVKHELVREAMRLAGIPRGIDIVTLADVPTRGTGLGSSSAVTVGVLNALYAFQGIYKSPLQLADEAARIEIDILGKPIGRQDQYAAAIGGINLIEFLSGGRGVRVEPVVCSSETLDRLHRSLLLFYTGRQRPAESVLRDQNNAISEGHGIDSLKKMRDLAYELRTRLGTGDADAVGELLHENWLLKRSLAEGLTDAEIDAWYEAARAAGATGGKLLGAGGGGFLLVAAPPARHRGIRDALRELREVPFQFAFRGTQISLLEHSRG